MIWETVGIAEKLNPELADISRRGHAGEELGEDEYKYTALLNKATWYFASMHYQYRAHNLTDEEWKQSRELIARYCAMPGFQKYWKDNRFSYASSFVEYIEGHWNT